MIPGKPPLPPSPEAGTPARLSVTANLDRLEELLEFARTEARKAGVAEKRLMSLDLVVEEAAVNVISYAYPDAPGPIELSCRSDGNEFVVELADEGPRYDPTAVPDPDTDLSLEERGVGGLGLHLIRHSCDGLSWRRDSDRNILSCRFTLHPATVPSTAPCP